jgi:pimeloyl-CoA synthetase|tara:strand:- start:215 stop:517 length:303 start_codon:yes stop_codon:yes gene_type:complete
MSQRVNIQYSIEMDRLEETVKHLFNKVLKRIGSLNQSMGNIDSFLDIELVEEIHQARLELAQVDIQLSDIDKIIKGYLSFKLNSDEVADEQAEQTVTTEE